ncbi:MAG: hypothetical protein K0Q72_982 [Armatimonadetes bacterium]|jgi:hypothetical protein|nr:hypothetical protein [Armatimonadota bacterium]
MPARKRILLLTSSLWLFAILAGVACARLGVRSDVPFWAICFASGLVAGVGTPLVTGSRDRSGAVAAVLLFGYACIGLARFWRGTGLACSST